MIAEFEMEMYGQYMFEKGVKEGQKEAQIRIATRMLEHVKDGEKVKDTVAQLLALDILQEPIDVALKNLGLAIQAD